MFRLGFRDTVAFLDAANELIALALDLIQLVVSQLAPLFLDLAFDLLPIPLYSIPRHFSVLLRTVALSPVDPVNAGRAQKLQNFGSGRHIVGSRQYAKWPYG